ncbi:MAG: phosphate signaling complex protein PhoU [Candidatus Dormibacteria bacterium]
MIRRQFVEDLEEVQSAVYRMGGLVEAAIGNAMNALTSRNAELATQVVEGDRDLDEIHRSVREQIFVVIATQQPVARDLRLLMGAQYIAVELERIGDYAARIAKRARTLLSHPQRDPLVDLARMGELATRQVHDILDALIRLDAEAATQIADRDDAIDRLYHRIFGEQLSAMAEDPEMAITAQMLINVAHTLERIGDRVTNIAEDIVFLDTGAVVELG